MESVAEPQLKPYRIATTYGTKRQREGDGRSQILATTHGPIRSRRLTWNYDPRLSSDANHEAAARALAVKITGEGATVREYSTDATGARRDWSVFA